MNPKILNRDNKLPDDGWYQIEAPGEHINHAARVIQVIDEQGTAAIVNRFNAEAAKVEAFAGMRIDKDHLGKSMENPTEALGWSMSLRNREGGGLEAKIGWTGLGRPLIESKPDQPAVYKFFSTEYNAAECERIETRIVNRKPYAVVRPLRLDGLSLTNDPNNKGQRPISNRSGNSADDGALEHPSMKNINTKLGLAEDAPEASTVEAIQKIQNRATTAEGQLTTLQTEHKVLLDAQVESDLTKYGKVIKNREAVKKQLIANRAGTIEVLESLQTATKETAPRITNREKAGTPDAQDDQVDEVAIAQKITNRATELKGSAPGRTFDSCWKQAQRETAQADQSRN